MLPWVIPILASIAGGLASTGLSSALAPDPQKPKPPPGQGLDSIAQANQGLGQQQQGMMSDDILMQFLSGSAGRKAG